MYKKAYIINFDKGGVLDTFDYKMFHNTLTTAKGLISWWHYLECTYIIIVDQSINSQGISQFIRQIAPKKRFLVSELNLKDHDGWLSKEAWDWINKFSEQLK